MRKIMVLFIIVCMFAALSVCGCGVMGDESSEQIKGSTESSSEEAGSAGGLPAGFPETVPMHEGADIIESSREVNGGNETYFVNMRFKGSAWNINEHFPGLNIAVYEEYQFDKGHVIRDILDSGKPDIIMIKECAAYFPPDEEGTTMEAYRDLIRDWVNLCRGEAVIVVLTTVVPIDPGNPGNQGGQLESILEYNDWIHDYCKSENISVLDLETAVRASEGNRVLDPVYDSGDGLHLNDRAYSERLDHILIPVLEHALEIGY